METNTNHKETNTMNTTTAPKMPRIAANKRSTLGLHFQRGIDDPIFDIDDATLCERVGLNQKQLDGYRAHARYIKANPMVLSPSHTDLPLHHQRAATGNGGWEWSVGGPFITCDTEQDLYYSRKAETDAKAEGRTVWAGRGTGWVAPVA